jgi:hypothetical protein
VTKLTTGDRVSYAAIGAVVGLFVGAMAAWLIGGSLYGESAGFAGVVGTAKVFVLGAALVCGAVGFVAGPTVGDFAGALVAALFRLHMPDDDAWHVPGWLVAVFLIGTALAVGWWLLRTAA